MELIDNETFLSDAAKQGIALDTRYAEPRTLGYQNSHWLAVPMPDDVRLRQRLVACALDLFANDSPVWLWRRSGMWWFDDGSAVSRAVGKLFSFAGVQNGASGTLHSSGGEKDFLFALIFMNSVSACCVKEDLFVIPNDKGLVLYFDHDGQIILECRDQDVFETIGKEFLESAKRLGNLTDDD